MMLGIVLVDRLVAVWIIGGETRPDVMRDAVLRRLGFTWMVVSGAVVPSRWGLAVFVPRPSRM